MLGAVIKGAVLDLGAQGQGSFPWSVSWSKLFRKNRVETWRYRSGESEVGRRVTWAGGQYAQILKNGTVSQAQ